MAFPGWKTENKTHRTFFFFCLFGLLGRQLLCQCWCKGKYQEGRELVGIREEGTVESQEQVAVG